MSTINLLPDNYLRHRAQHRANILCVVLFAAIMGGVGWASMASEKNHSRLQTYRAQVNEEYARTFKIIEKMYELEGRKAQMTQKADDTAALMEKMPRSYLLGLTAQMCPKNVTLYKFELVTAKIAGPKEMAKFDKALAGRVGASPVYGVELLLTGYAKSDTDVDVARFLLALENSPAVARADLDSTRDLRDDDMSVREFKFHLYLIPNADAIEMLPGHELTAATGPVR